MGCGESNMSTSSIGPTLTLEKDSEIISRSRSMSPVPDYVVEQPVPTLQPTLQPTLPQYEPIPPRHDVLPPDYCLEQRMEPVMEALPSPEMPPPEEMTVVEQVGDLFEPLSPEQNMSPAVEPMEYTSDADGQDLDAGYEEISSDDEFELASGDIAPDFDIEDDSWTYSMTTFNPFACELTPFMTFPDVAHTTFEQEKGRLLAESGDSTRVQEATKLLDIISQFTTTDHHAKWVEALEGVPALLPKGLSYLVHKGRNQAIVDTLISWMLEGLDEGKAIAQPESTYKVRHLKMGFKLAGALCACDSQIARKVLGENVQGRLLDHFESPCMSFSLKLQIVSALDQTVRLQDGIEWFLGRHPDQPPTFGAMSSYQRAVACLLKKQVVHVIVAMTALIKKVHSYEVMNKLTQSLDSLLDSLPDVEEMGERGLDPDTELDDRLTPQLEEGDVDTVLTCLDDITRVFSLANTLIAQPGRTLPGKTMFETSSILRDPYPDFYHMANTSHLLESLFVLVSVPAMYTMPMVFGAVRRLLQKMCQPRHGLLYLGSRPDITNGIIRALIMLDYNREEGVEEAAAQQLGLELTHYLQAMLHTDQLRHYLAHWDRKNLDEADAVSALHSLYTMTATPLGRTAVVHVLALDTNLDSIIPFIQVKGGDHKESKLKRSVCANYATELVTTVVHYSSSVTFLQQFGGKLLELGESEFNSKLSHLKEWLVPVKSLTKYSQAELPAVIELLKAHSDDVVKLPRGLITILRVVTHLAIAPPTDYPEDKAEELKYKYALIELFSADCFPIFVSFLKKLTEVMLRPWQKGIPKSSEQVHLFLSIIKPSLAVVKLTSQYLIMARGTEFRDLTALPVLFELHAVFCSVPASSIFTQEIMEMQRDIVDTIAAYTQPVADSFETSEKISKSLWTLTIRELLKFTTKAPWTYLSGLLLLSELLPLPLPLQTRESLTKEEELLALNTRKLWSAHLLSLHSALYSIIRSLSVTSCQPLQQVLRKICWQLSDLAAPTATMITKCILDILLENMGTAAGLEVKATKPQPDPEGDGSERPTLTTQGRFLNLMSYFISQPAIKCTVLHLIGPDGEEKYTEVLPKMLVILNEVSDRPSHIQDQECIVSILQSLIDVDITLTSRETTLQEQVANGLPNHEQLSVIIKALLEHIAHPSHKYDTVLPCIRALVMLTEHDYSFYLLKSMFDKHKLALYRLLSRIKFKFSKDSSDCLSTFSTTLEFLRRLVLTEPASEEIPLARTITLSNQELRDVVAWTQNLTNHPLVDLRNKLEESSKEEETLESLVESVQSLICLLRNTTPQKARPEIVPPTLPKPETLANLFNIRLTYAMTDPEDERLTAIFWQPTFEPDEPDLVVTDVEELHRKYCGDFNLADELQKSISMPADEELNKPRKLKDRRKSQEFVSFRGRGGMRRPYVAPMRGRGIARGLAAQANRHDPFRSRAPNTSRPPSMHVDDFMKLEKGGRSSSPDNAAPVRREGDFNRGGHGRGFDRGRFLGRGRFFTPPGNFSRHEGSTRGGHVGDGAVPYGSRPKQPLLSTPRSFPNRAPESYPMSGDQRGGRDGRFQTRGSWRTNWNSPRFKNDRFPGGDFRERRDQNRHQRSFTK